MAAVHFDSPWVTPPPVSAWLPTPDDRDDTLAGDRFEGVCGTASVPATAPGVPATSSSVPAADVDPLLLDLGFDRSTGTISKLPRSDAVATARACGTELSTHTRIYSDYLREKLLRCVRAHSADYVRGRGDEATADRLESAHSLRGVADLLEPTGHLRAAVRFAARQTPEPMKAALAKVCDADDVRDLDNLALTIVDLDDSGTLDERDILAVELGSSSVIGPVGRDLADRLRLSACVVRGMDQLVDSWTGESLLSFTPGRFEGPDTWFRVERDHFALRQEKVPDKPWLTRPRSASAALRHVVENADDYTMDCAAAISVAWFLGKYHEIGELAGSDRQDEVFDRVTPHLTIGMWHVHWSNVLQHGTVDVDPRTDVPLPGESRYFKASDISPHGRLAGWQGENVLFYGTARADGPGYRKGERIWFGHPFGLTGEREIVSTLNAHSFDLDPAGLPALREAIAAGSHAAFSSQLQALEKKVCAYVDARAGYDEFMKTNGRAYQKARDRAWYLESEHFTDDPEYPLVKEEYKRLRDAIGSLDRRAKSLASGAARDASALRERAAGKSDELVALIDQLLPPPSLMFGKGRVLRPYRAFQDRGNNAVKLL